MTTVSDLMRSRKGVAPGFGLLRHVLAVLILINHSYKVAVGSHLNDGYVKNDFLSQAGHLSAGQTLIELLRPLMFSFVGAFFVLSGFLVYGSALRNPKVRDFLTLRVIRILPALLVEVTLSALLLGPLVTNLPLSIYFSDPDFTAYFGNIVGLIRFHLPGVFTTNPTPNWVNLNLWTLPSEFECYAVLALLLLVGLTRKRWLMLTAFLAASVVILAMSAFGEFALRGSAVSYGARFLVYLYFWGVLAFMFAEYVPIRLGFFILAIVGFYVLTLVGLPDVYAAPFLAYATIYLGFCDFSWFDRFAKGDYSYGIYLYGFPISQAIVYYLSGMLTGHSVPARIAIVTALTLATTVLVAFASWHLVERKSLKLRHRVVAKPQPVAA